MSVSRKGLLSGMIFAAFVIFLCAFGGGLAALIMDIPDELISFFGILVPGAAAYCSAYRSTQINRSKGIVQGLVCGITLFSAVFLLSLLFSQCSFSEIMAVKAAVCVFFGIIGGVVGINTKKTKR